ncbi:MAG: hypothetical protein IPI97_11550 [Nitrosomonas sp.]|jgi:hypothetical protein|nr:hypothetical protein [Nitrosomonas sp.]
MLLKNEKSYFEMIVTNYEFPEIHDDRYDSNWLIIEIRVTLAKGSWSASYPCMLTDELANLADWLDTLADGKITSTRLGFFEPNLYFEVTELEPRKLYVYLDAEFKSAGVLGNDSDIDEPDCIEFEIIPKELKDAVVSLRTCLQAFPNRTYAD